MANFAASELETRFLIALQANVSTDPPVSTVASAGSVAASDSYKFLNNAYARIWELWGGSKTNAPSATLWSPGESVGTAGKAVGVLQTVSEILHLYHTTTDPFALSCGTTNNSTAVTSAALFGSVVAGMDVSGAGITAGTYVVSVADTSNLVISQNATATGSPSLTFSPTTGTELDRVDLSQIEFLRSNSTGLGVYTTPQVYAVSMIASANSATGSNKFMLDYWPGLAGFHFPATYRPQFTALAAATDVPDLPDLAQLDIAMVAAWDAAPLVGRTDLQESIARQVSEKSQLLLVRRAEAMVDARQDG